MAVVVRPATGQDLDGCVDVLDEGDRVEGFVLVEARYPTTAEITCAAVRPEVHRVGIGTMLVDAVFALPGWQPGNPAAIYAAALASRRERCRRG